MNRRYAGGNNSKEDDAVSVEVEYGNGGGFRAFEDAAAAAPPKTVRINAGPGHDAVAGDHGTVGTAGGGGGGASYHNHHSVGPVDLDELYEDDTDSLLSDEDGDHRLLVDESDSNWQDDYDFEESMNRQPKFFNNPNKRLLDHDASLIPGSPFSKPPNKPSNRPSEPLAIAKYASVTSALVTLGWICFLIYNALDFYE
jgi:hypothetical protein